MEKQNLGVLQKTSPNLLSCSLNTCVGVKGMLDKIGMEINNFAKMFPVEPSLVNFTKFLNEQQKSIESYYPQIDQMDFYRWALKLSWNSHL